VQEHKYDCTDDCECICGLPMNGNDHSDCSIELRPCPEHKAEWEQGLGEARSGEKQTEIEQDAAPRPHSECGCRSDIDPGKVVGWCLHCDHVYANYTPELQDRKSGKVSAPLKNTVELRECASGVTREA